MKIVFYSLLVIINVVALGFISIAFLGTPSAGGTEGAIEYTELEIFFRRLLYVAIVSMVFSTCALIVVYIFRNSLNFQKKSFLKIFLGEFILFIATYFLLYTCIYIF